MKKHLLSTGALVWYFNTFIPYSIQRIDVNLEKLSRDVLVISVISFYLFTLFMGFSRQEYWVVCHSLLQWITFCQTSPPQPICLGWPHTAWLSFIELDKAVVLWSDWLFSVIMASVCLPSDALSHTCHLTRVSLTLDVSGTVVENLRASAGNTRDISSAPGSGRSPGAGNGSGNTYCSILAWKIPWTAESDYSSCGPKESDATEHARICIHRLKN